jgi:serine protease Do
MKNRGTMFCSAMSLKAIGPKLTFAAALGGVLSLWLAACAANASNVKASGGSPNPSSPSAIESMVPKAFLPHPAFAQSGNAQATIADIAEKVAPSVVNVSSSRTIKNVHERAPFFDDPFFRQFFGPGMGGQGPRSQQSPQSQEEKHQESGLGSGVVVSADGIILTNNHVVEGADEIKVTTGDKREYAAKVLGTDAKSDVAVLKLQGTPTNLKPLDFGDSSRLRLGDVVLAIGNPFGVGQTITMGIVSAKGRANVGIAAYEDFIQTDAAINPGNSGGALVDMEGHLIGINTAILSRTGGNMGIGFAIPSNMAQPIMKALMERGKVVRGWLGVGIQDIDQELASAMNLKTVDGVLLSEIMDNGPGAKSGLKSGDVVLELNGQKVDSTGGFRNAVATAGAGATVKLELLRDGKPVEVEAKLGELPEKPTAKAGASDPSGGTPAALDGITLEDLNPAARRKFEVPASVKSGVVVTDLDPNSAVAQSGLRPGDVVVELNRAPVTDVGAFKAAYAKTKERALFRVLREGRSFFIVVKR